ncbi:hypothetical protein [Nesterenkonia alba]|uniref:hypothetical protein n=1 Tax=Nesterenkonia alba TaxID=515814 RepID=UPI0003B38544|nr:hypothetical protein [Nesterenkonia alba]
MTTIPELEESTANEQLEKLYREGKLYHYPNWFYRERLANIETLKGEPITYSPTNLLRYYTSEKICDKAEEVVEDPSASEELRQMAWAVVELFRSESSFKHEAHEFAEELGVVYLGGYGFDHEEEFESAVSAIGRLVDAPFKSGDTKYEDYTAQELADARARFAITAEHYLNAIEELENSDNNGILVEAEFWKQEEFVSVSPLAMAQALDSYYQRFSELLWLNAHPHRPVEITEDDYIRQMLTSGYSAAVLDSQQDASSGLLKQSVRLYKVDDLKTAYDGDLGKLPEDWAISLLEPEIIELPDKDNRPIFSQDELMQLVGRVEDKVTAIQEHPDLIEHAVDLLAEAQEGDVDWDGTRSSRQHSQKMVRRISHKQKPLQSIWHVTSLMLSMAGAMTRTCSSTILSTSSRQHSMT